MRIYASFDNPKMQAALYYARKRRLKRIADANAGPDGDPLTIDRTDITIDQTDITIDQEET